MARRTNCRRQSSRSKKRIGLQGIDCITINTGADMQNKTGKSSAEYTLITGGAGFVGTNLADRLLSEGKSVMIFDNLSREGVRSNLSWLQNKHPKNLQVMIADIRDVDAVTTAVEHATHIFHFAAQVAVTT